MVNSAPDTLNPQSPPPCNGATIWSVPLTKELQCKHACQQNSLNDNYCARGKKAQCGQKAESLVPCPFCILQHQNYIDLSALYCQHIDKRNDTSKHPFSMWHPMATRNPRIQSLQTVAQFQASTSQHTRMAVGNLRANDGDDIPLLQPPSESHAQHSRLG